MLENLIPHLNKIRIADAIDYMESLPANSVDLIFADPPYNLQLQKELYRPNQTKVSGVHDDWDQFLSFQDYDDFTKAWLKSAKRVLKDNGTLFVIGSYHNIYRVGTILLDLGFWILNDIIWHKTNPMPNFQGTRFQSATETLLWVQKANAKKYTFNYRSMKNMNDDKQMQNVWYLPICTGAERLKVEGQKLHSTQKPESLLYRVIMSASNLGDVVLDPFMGAGTTAAVAKKLGRYFLGCDDNEIYVEAAIKRVNDIESPLPELLACYQTPNKRNRQKVPFSTLIEQNYLKVSQKLFDKNKKIIATILADGYISIDGERGSIHKIGALVQNKTACNGWDFWYYETDENILQNVDILREKYLADIQKDAIETII
jgi:site-specific DNA-methyltransferase (adenine-specific)/modification methylase